MSKEVLNSGKLLPGIFTMQENLINRYVERDMLPPRGLDINDPKTAEFFRKAVGWLTEEVFEAEEDNKALVMNIMQNDPKDATMLLKNYSKEMGDVLAFLIEIMIYAEIGPKEVEAYYEQVASTQNLPIITGDGLSTGYRFARHLGFYENPDLVDAKRYAKTLVPLAVYEMEYYAGYVVGVELHKFQVEGYFNLIGALWRGVNFLKRKPWVEGDRPFVNVPLFQQHIMEAFTWYLSVADMGGWEPKGIYYHFERVNKLNHKRLDEGY